MGSYFFFLTSQRCFLQGGQKKVREGPVNIWRKATLEGSIIKVCHWYNNDQMRDDVEFVMTI